MITQIMTAVDGSEYSLRAIDYAVDLTTRYNATLCVVHAYPHTSDLLGYDDFAKLVSRRKNAGQALLDKVRRQITGTNITIVEELIEGPEAEAILKIAEASGIDLIVMGTRGLGSLKGILLGSVSRKVLHHAGCPVMVVR
ncbi:MAG: universal stress protein [Desulfobacteraceae bacterium]|nr:universal stress protein [Desulfobacteraceae bacterium]